MDRRSSHTSDTAPRSAAGQEWTQRRPLIEQCTNEWQKDQRYRETSSPDFDPEWTGTFETVVKRVWAVIKAPKFQRLAGVFLVGIVLTVFLWHQFLSIMVAENKAAWDSLNAESQSRHDNLFGANKRVRFPGMIQLSTMDPKYLPRTSKANPAGTSKHKRLIFIGDIHGCMDELQALLLKAKFDPDNDHIIAAGDMINKGPKSKEVVEFLMKHDASCVRGNHEDRVLLVAKNDAGVALTTSSALTQAGDNRESNAVEEMREELQLGRSLSQKQLEWLQKCPVILQVGNLGTHGDVVTVHGGLIPGIRLENQDPMSVMNMRIIHLATHMPSHKHSEEGFVPWADFWNDYQRLLPAQRTLFGPKSQPKVSHTTVVYGHDAKRGLQVHKYTKGLDTGCAKGKKLTAWIVGDLGKEEIVQVSCKHMKQS